MNNDIDTSFLISLKEHGAYYHKKGSSPLIAYHGKYFDEKDKKLKNFVGEDYFNMAMIDEKQTIFSIAKRIIQRMPSNLSERINCFCGAPIGGYSFSLALAKSWNDIMQDENIRNIKAEKDVLILAGENNREESKVIFKRHKINKKENYIIVEDVFNNGSTCKELFELITSNGGNVLGIACIINRSEKCDNAFFIREGSIPIFYRAYLPTQQYRQDDPKVIEDVLNNNVCFNPKAEWDKLLQSAKNQ